MRAAAFVWMGAAAWVLVGCSSAPRPQSDAGAAPLGVPRGVVDVVRPAPLRAVSAETPFPSLPDRIVVPSTYRLVLLDGHWALVRETDPETQARAPGSIQALSGEPANAPGSYHPEPLPQELAAEIEAARQSSARMDNALAEVMARSRELSEQAAALQAEAKRLAARPPADAPAPPKPASAPVQPPEGIQN